MKIILSIIFLIFLLSIIITFIHGAFTGYNEALVTQKDFSSVNNLSGHEFEYYCASLLKKNNYKNVTVTPGSGDQGVDIIATKDGIRYAIQCKKYTSPLGNTPVQEVCAGKIFYNCDIGIVMTNSTFTKGAIALANATGTILWDRNVLFEMHQA